MNVPLANRMCNFALEVDIPNYKGLNLLCQASWLLDHDMFEVGSYYIIYFEFVFEFVFLFTGSYECIIK